MREELDEKHEEDRERRLEAVKRWVEYIESAPPETWGPQQNAVVDGQLEAAQNAGISAAHRKRVEDAASRILDANTDGNDR
ncbi:Uncharacterized protein HSRCO_1875 [Halanaeroarchaeum sp. HSR-CO]|nr:Uncharacterized protein HSRCO_1875 [Halanaeroarchaeum sp. HSR-CO]